MPELPEVETILKGLKPFMLSNIISNIRINRYDLRKIIPQNFSETCSRRTITAMCRRAKYIIIHLDNAHSIILHLGMSGRIRIYNKDETYQKKPHDHVIFTMDTGARIIFEDPRRFGMLYLERSDQLETCAPFNTMGPEPFDVKFSDTYLYEQLGRRKSDIKTSLLNQKIVVGLGNIYVCEALFRAKISPLRAAHSLSMEDVRRLIPIIRKVLQEAIDSGGSSLKDYRQASGEMGYFQHNFRVYGRENEACVTHQCPSRIVRCVQANRSTFYCPQCQV